MAKAKKTSLIVKPYLENKCNERDLETISNLFQDHEHDKQIRTILYEYWTNTPSFQDKIEKDELDQMLHLIHETIAISQAGQKSIFKIASFYAVRIAAILFIPLLIASIWFFSQNGTYHKNNTYITLETPMGSKLKTTLPDGTKVWQNAGTTLQYPGKFTKHNREVVLTGEAYFHVTSDKKNPFYVKTDDGTIQVTGTRFNVCSFPDDNFSSVVLEEGQVSYIPKNKKLKTFELQAEDQLIYRNDSKEITRQKTDIQKHIAWTTGKLIFRNDPLVDVVRRLNRWYNADISLNDPENQLGQHPFTMTIQNETLPQVIEFITQAANLKVERNNTKQTTGETLQKPKYIISK